MKRHRCKSTDAQHSSRDTCQASCRSFGSVSSTFWVHTYSTSHACHRVHALTSHFFSVPRLRSTKRHGTMAIPENLVCSGRQSVLPPSSSPNPLGLRMFRSATIKGLDRCNSPAPHANNNFTTKSPNMSLVVGSLTLRQIRF